MDVNGVCLSFNAMVDMCKRRDHHIDVLGDLSFARCLKSFFHCFCLRQKKTNHKKALYLIGKIMVSTWFPLKMFQPNQTIPNQKRHGRHGLPVVGPPLWKAPVVPFAQTALARYSARYDGLGISGCQFRSVWIT